MRPVRGVGDEAVFHRVEMNVVHMEGVILVIADGVFPETALPDGAFALAGAAGGNGLAGGDFAGEVHLDGLPADGEIGVARRESPKAMEVIGEDHARVDVEGALLFGLEDRGA